MSTKLKAYYKEHDTWHTVTRWEILSMSEVAYMAFKDTHTFYINRDEESEKLTFNRLQKTFRYYPTSDYRECDRENGMTLSHLIAQEIICEMEELKFKLTDRRTRENKQYEIVLKRSNSCCEYIESGFIFDVRLFFNEPYELALKWGGRVNIEVFATNKTKSNKIAYCEEKKEALIEVKLSQKLLYPNKIYTVTKDDENDIRAHIEAAFAKQIYGDILVSPSSETYLNNKIIDEKNKEIDHLKRELKKAHGEKSNNSLISKIKKCFQ